MKRTILLVLALTMLVAGASMAAKLQTTAITHLNQVYQACAATSLDCREFAGYLGLEEDVTSSSPGVLDITPGGPNWPNFVGAAQVSPVAVPYTIKNVTLVKQTPEFVQCRGIFPPITRTQQGTPNIRLWWPLMYETPSTTFTLSILYGTPDLFDDDGPGGNPPSWVHLEQWTWHVDADLPHLALLLELFHELPFGRDEVPLVSDENLYVALQAKIAATIAAFTAGDLATAASILGDFEMEVMDACIPVSPAFPNPGGPGTGIAQTDENPACCKLLVDVEYIGVTTGIFQAKK